MSTAASRLADVNGIVSLEKLRATFMHEIAHMVGLDHVRQQHSADVLLRHVDQHVPNGDLEGLWRVGAAQGCLAGDEAPADDTPPSGPTSNRSSSFAPEQNGGSIGDVGAVGSLADDRH